MRALRAVHRRVWGPSSYDATYGATYDARARRSPPAGRTRAAGLAAIAFGVLLVLLGLAPSTANATQPNPDHKVTLCHRTDSYSNPYVRITVDVASVLHDGHDHHDGPVFFPAIPKHTKWGDIIPPFDFGPGETYAGKNWTPAGRDVFDNGCALPTSPTTTSTSTATTSTIPSTTSTVLVTSTSTAPRGGGSTTTTSVPVVAGSSTTTSSSVTSTTVSTVTIGGSTTEPPVTVLGGSVVSLGGGSTTVASAEATTSTSLPFTGSSPEPLIAAGLVLVGAGLGLTRRRGSTG